MKAITRRKYGSPEVLHFSEVDAPTPGPGKLLLKVAAASVNPYDWHFLRGEPYLLRLMFGFFTPKQKGLGADVAGTVVGIGEGAEGFAIGDEVFGWGEETFAEYALAKATSVAHKPKAMEFESASSLPCAGITALQALRDKAKIQPGQHVLINGAAGGVGTLAVQIAKSFGASVTGVCSAASADLVRSLGADDVVDYVSEDFSKGPRTFDVVLDLVGNRSLRAYRRAAGREGVVVLAGGSKGKWFAPMKLIAKAILQDRFVPQRLETLMANIGTVDLDVLSQLVISGDLTPVIQETFSLSATASAVALVEAGHVHGKVVVRI
jgi:NADPH:quinone reductase-like Zn-dependent oxidoreductase